MNTADNKQSVKERISRHALLFQCVGFGLVMVVLWLDELLDIPRWLLGAEPTPVNWREGILESAMVFIIGGQTFAWTDLALGRIRRLEGFLIVCAQCRKTRISEHWVPLEAYLSEHPDAAHAHRLCPTCEDTLYWSAQEGRVGHRTAGDITVELQRQAPQRRGVRWSDTVIRKADGETGLGDRPEG
jgi:hypothetical protein